MASSKGRLIALLAFAVVWSGVFCALLCLEPAAPACQHCHAPRNPTSASCPIQVAGEAPQANAALDSERTAPASNGEVASPTESVMPRGADLVEYAALQHPLGLAASFLVLRI